MKRAIIYLLAVPAVIVMTACLVIAAPFLYVHIGAKTIADKWT